MKPKLNFIEAAMKHKQITLFVTALLLLLGVYSLKNMPRAEMPKIDLPVAMVMAFYPGADEVQTEQQVTNKIEQYLFSFEEIDKEKTTSETKAGQVFITVYTQPNVKDRKKFWSTLQHGMNMNMAATLPKGVMGPIVNSNFGDVTAQIITVSSSTRSYAEIDDYLNKLEDEFKQIPTVSKMNRSGGQKQQILVSLDDAKMQQYGFGLSEVVNILQAQNVTGYSGELTIENNTIPIQTSSQFKTENEVANQIVYTSPKGAAVRLKDIATIKRTYEELSSYVRVGSDKTMVLAIEMQPGNNIVDFGKTIEHKLAEVQRTFPDDIKLDVIVNQPEVVGESINHFLKEFLIAIIAVVFVIILLLPVNVALVASLAAPISIMITFGVLNLLGVELHQVTLVGLIIVMGMVVDNAIVVVDNYIEKLDEGISPWDAAWQSAKQLSLPIFTATLAIIFAFMPLAFFMHGVAKDFIAALPITVGVALLASMLVALLLTPYTCYVFIKKGLKHKMENRKTQRKSLLDRLQGAFNKGIEAAFQWPKTTIGLGIAAVLFSFVIAGKVKQEFFPLSEVKQFNAEVWMPLGTSLAKTDSIAHLVENEFKKDKRVVRTASFIGTGSPRFNIAYSSQMPRTSYAQIFITAKSADDVNAIVKEYLPRFERFIPDGHVNLRQISMQSGSPIAVRIIGENLNDQKRVSEQVKNILEKAEGTNWIRTNYMDDYFALSVKPKEDVALRLGVPNKAITQTLGAGLKGFTVSQLWEGDQPVDIFLRLDAGNRRNYDDLSNLNVGTMFGGKVPLKEVADFTPSWHTGVIAHKNGLRTLTVMSEAQKGLKASTILKVVKPEIDKIELPEGIRIEYGGDAESSSENGPGMGKALGVSLILIFLTLLFQFKTVGKALIILATFPLSLLGAFSGLVVFNNPMGMTAFMGIISLIGIVVRNGIILVDYADELIHDHGYTKKAAALAAAKRRMRPIFLTSAAAAVGVVPMIISKSPMWAPLGSVLSFGLIFSMILTLFIVPVLYYLFVKAPEPATNSSKHLVEHETPELLA